jgi:hypothetical protein
MMNIKAALVSLPLLATPSLAGDMLAELRRENPKITKANVIEATNTMQVYVPSDGSARTGFAQYVCMFTLDYEKPPSIVLVLESGASGRIMGTARCPTKDEEPSVVEFN